MKTSLTLSVVFAVLAAACETSALAEVAAPSTVVLGSPTSATVSAAAASAAPEPVHYARPKVYSTAPEAAPAEEKKEEEEEEEPLDPTIRPLQYFKDEFIAACCPEDCWLKTLQLYGYIDTQFTYNFNRPDKWNSMRVYDRKHADFMVNMVQFYALKESTKESRWGFGTKLAFGYDADTNSPYDETNTDKVDLQEIWGSWLFDIGNENGMLVKAGRMGGLPGAEVIEQKDNWNISRGLIFMNTPFTVTGIRSNYKINDVYDFTMGVNRGWDTFRRDNNDALSYEARLGATCSDKLSMGTTFLYGPEQEDNDNSNRALLDYLITYKFTDKLTGMLNAEVANEDDAAVDGGSGNWYALAAYLKYDCNDKLSYAWRGEIFDDSDGARTGTQQTLWENTLTAQYKFRENLIGRLEFRHDHSDEDVFEKSSGFGGTQNTIAASMMITF